MPTLTTLPEALQIYGIGICLNVSDIISFSETSQSCKKIAPELIKDCFESFKQHIQSCEKGFFARTYRVVCQTWLIDDESNSEQQRKELSNLQLKKTYILARRCLKMASDPKLPPIPVPASAPEIDFQFQNLSPQNLDKVMEEIAQSGDCKILNILMKSGQFDKITNPCLGRAMITAAEFGKIKLLKALMNLGRGYEISTDNLNMAFAAAAARCSLSNIKSPKALMSLKVLMNSGRGYEISTDNVNMALVIAAIAGEIKFLKTLMNLERFTMNALNSGLSRALFLAAKFDKVKSLKTIINDVQFHQIPPVVLKEALDEVIRHRNFKSLYAICNSTRFFDIQPDTFLVSLLQAIFFPFVLLQLFIMVLNMLQKFIRNQILVFMHRA